MRGCGLKQRLGLEVGVGHQVQQRPRRGAWIKAKCWECRCRRSTSPPAMRGVDRRSMPGGALEHGECELRHSRDLLRPHLRTASATKAKRAALSTPIAVQPPRRRPAGANRPSPPGTRVSGRRRTPAGSDRVGQRRWREGVGNPTKRGRADPNQHGEGAGPSDSPRRANHRGRRPVQPQRETESP